MAMFLRSVKTKKQRLPSRMLPIHGAPRRKTTNYFQYPTHVKHPYESFSDSDDQMESDDTFATSQIEDDVFESDSQYSDSEETEEGDSEEDEETSSSSELEDEYSSDDNPSDVATEQFIKFKASQKRALSSSSSDHSFVGAKVYRKAKKMNSSDSSPVAVKTRRKAKKLDTSSESGSDEEIQVPGSMESDTYKKHAMVSTPPLTGNGPYNWPWL